MKKAKRLFPKEHLDLAVDVLTLQRRASDMTR